MSKSGLTWCVFILCCLVLAHGQQGMVCGVLRILVVYSLITSFALNLCLRILVSVPIVIWRYTCISTVVFIHSTINLLYWSMLPPPPGITFVLREDTYTLNDIVTITDIGVTIPNGENNGLRANTTHSPCCQNPSMGNWYLPGVATPLGFSTTADFSRSRSVNSEVILSRRNDVTAPTGIYRCNLPDNTGALVDVYIGIYLESTGQRSSS